MTDGDLNLALQYQQAGRFADAARVYHAVLLQQPDNPDALNLFGVLHHQNGYFERAVELIGRAITLRPQAAAYHPNQAEAYRALGQYQQAIDCCQTALRLRAAYPEAANNLGLALHDLGRFGEAVAQFRAAIAMRPGFAVAHNNLGTSLLELRQFGQAIAAYRVAVENEPDLALAHSNLGQLLVDQGQAEEGLIHCQHAVRLQSDVPAALNNLGNAYRALERWGEAHAAYDQAQALAAQKAKEPGDLPQILANRGMALFLEGKRGDAYELFRQAVDLVPSDVGLRRYQANAHDAAEDHAAARACWQKIVEMTPHDAAAHNALGWSLQQEGRFGEAAGCYSRALELNAGLIDAIVNQGGLHEELGEMADAEARYRHARVLQPDAPNPLAHLAQMLRGKLPQEDIAAIDAQVAALPPNSPARGPLLYGLAQVLDARGDYARTADCLEQANALAREQRRREGKSYDRATHSALVDRIIAGFTRQLFERFAAADLAEADLGAGDARLPVFVFGMPRSGTTLVEQVLASHSRVLGAGELRLGCDTFQSVPAVLSMPDDMEACLAALDGAALTQIRRRHLAELRTVLNASAGGAGSLASPDRIVDKMPDNYLYIGLLGLLFPRAAFIHVRRDLRDVAVSCWMTNFRSIRWADDKANLAARCRDYRRLIDHWHAVLPVRMHEVVYERLVDDFDTEAPRLLSACGLEWEESCGQFHQTLRPVKTASVTQVRQPLYRKAVARWKHYEGPLADLFARLPADPCTLHKEAGSRT